MIIKYIDNNYIINDLSKADWAEVENPDFYITMASQRVKTLITNVEAGNPNDITTYTPEQQSAIKFATAKYTFWYYDTNNDYTSGSVSLNFGGMSMSESKVYNGENVLPEVFDILKQADLLQTTETYSILDIYNQDGEPLDKDWKDKVIDRIEEIEDVNIVQTQQIRDLEQKLLDKNINYEGISPIIVDSIRRLISVDFNEFNKQNTDVLTKQQVYNAIYASGIVWQDNFSYKKDWVVQVVDDKNILRFFIALKDNRGQNPLTSPEFWKEVEVQEIDLNVIVDQLKPYIDTTIDNQLDTKLQALPTTDYVQETEGQIIPFKNEQDYEAYKIATGKQDSDFENVPNPTPDLTNYVEKVKEGNLDIERQGINVKQFNFIASQNTTNYRQWNEWNFITKFGSENNTILSIQNKHINNKGVYLLAEENKINFINPTQLINVKSPTNNNEATNKQYVDTQIQNTNEQVTTINNKLNSVISGLENANIVSFKGNWEAGKTYNIGDAVIHNNKLCISLKANNIGNEPINSNEFWNVDQTSTIDLTNYARKDQENTFTQRQIMKEVIIGANATSNRIFASKFTYEGKEYGAVKATNAQGQNLLQFEVNFTDKTANISSPATNNNFTIYNLKDPQGAREAVNKQYVDNAINVSKTTAGSDTTFSAIFKKSNLEFHVNKLSGRTKGVQLFTKEGSSGETTPIKYNITTNEQLTGNYYLGKPIYTRSFSFTNITSRSVNTILEGVENVVSSTTMVQGVRSQEWRQLPLIVADGQEIELRLTTGGKLYILNRFNEANINVKGVVQYTKI